MARALPAGAIIASSLFFTGITYASTLPYGAVVGIDTLGISNTGYAALLTLSALAQAAASVALGVLSDRVPDRRLIVIACAVLGAIAYGLVYLSHTQWAFVVATGLVMPFGGALFSQSFSFARSYYNERLPDRAEFMVSMLRTLFAVAWVIVPPIAGYIAATYSVFDVFGVAAAAYLVCAALFGVLMLDGSARIGRPATVAGADAGTSTPPARIALPVVFGIGGVMIINVAIGLNSTTAPLAIVSNFGGTLADVGIYAGLAALLEVPCMLLWGHAATRWPKHTLIVASTLIYALYLLLVANAHSVSGVLWLQGLNAAATAGLMAIPLAYLQEAIRGRIGLSTSLLDVVGVVARIGTAAVFALVTGGGGNYPAVFNVAAGFAVVGAAVLFLAHARFVRFARA
ncbi:MAG TPA: MFS transporter [Bauldia sp.]|nr:MFS transporter [Bauldia sp.]